MNFAKNFKNTVSPMTASVTEYSLHMKTKQSVFISCLCGVDISNSKLVAVSNSVRIHLYSNYESITHFFLVQSCKPPALTWLYTFAL